MRKQRDRSVAGFPNLGVLSRDKDGLRLTLYCAGERRPDAVVFGSLEELTQVLLAAGLSSSVSNGVAKCRDNNLTFAARLSSTVSGISKNNGPDLALVQNKPAQRHVQGAR
jgi:hypothetical protein